MKYFPWLEIYTSHKYFASGRMDSLAFAPTAITQRWLKNHGCLWKFENGSLKISIGEDVINKNTAKVIPISDELTLDFGIGVNDLSYSQYTEIDDSPLHYFQHLFQAKIQLENLSKPQVVISTSTVMEKEKNNFIDFNGPYTMFGQLSVEMVNVRSIFENLKEDNVNSICLNFEVKSYSLCYVVRKSENVENFPQQIVEENGKVQFGRFADASDRFDFFISQDKVKITELNKLEFNCLGNYAGEKNVKLRCKAKKFALNNLGVNPLDSKQYLLINEIEY